MNPKLFLLLTTAKGKPSTKAQLAHLIATGTKTLFIMLAFHMVGDSAIKRLTSEAMC